MYLMLSWWGCDIVKKPEAISFNKKAVKIPVYLLITSIYNGGRAQPSASHEMEASAMVTVVTNEED